MPRLPISYAVTAATYAGLSANDFPDGQRVVVTDDGNKEYEARGADGARSWVQIHGGSVQYEVLLDGDSQPVDNGQDDWLYIEVSY